MLLLFMASKIRSRVFLPFEKEEKKFFIAKKFFFLLCEQFRVLEKEKVGFETLAEKS